MPDFTVLLSVGPHERELQRLGDFLDSLFHYEPATPSVVLVDDSRRPRLLHRMFRIPAGCQLVSLPNPRKGWGDGWLGGACAATLTGLAWVRRNRPGDFVLKADTDALVIGPFAERVAERFRQVPMVGMLGTHLVNPDGKARLTRNWAGTFQTLLRPVCLRGKRLQITLWGGSRQIRRALIAALGNGYRLTEHCQGGAYAVRPEMIERMAAAGYLDRPLRWLRIHLGEDVMMGMYAYAAGFGLSDFNRKGEPFGVQYQGLPAAPDELLARGYGIVHSVKDHGEHHEEEVRLFFRAVRQLASVRLGAEVS